MATPMPEVASPAPWLPAGFDIAAFPVENDSAYRYAPREIPLPSPALRATVSGPELGAFLYIGSAWAGVCAQFLDPHTRVHVLDIGCGVGKTARFLHINPRLAYCGFDIFLPAIEWCRRAFGPVTGERFRFEHFDGVSAMYNPEGRIAASEYVFPAADDSVDAALAASVFTHLCERDIRRYFDETHRVLKPGGVAIFSFYFFEDLPRVLPGAPAAPDGPTYGNEQMMFLRRDHLFRMAGASGLAVREQLGLLCGQHTVVFSKL